MPPTYDDVKQGAIFTNSKNIRCRVESLKDNTVHLTVLDGKTVNGQRELTMPISEFAQGWALAKAAA